MTHSREKRNSLKTGIDPIPHTEKNARGNGPFKRESIVFPHVVTMKHHYFRKFHLLFVAFVLVAAQPMQMVCSCSCCKNHRTAAAWTVTGSCCAGQEKPTGGHNSNCQCEELRGTRYCLNRPRTDFCEDNETPKLPCVKELFIASESTRNVSPLAHGTLDSLVTRHRCAALCRFLL